MTPLEDDMELSVEYDLAIKNSIKTKEKYTQNDVYFNDLYRENLINSMTEKQKENFKNEYNKYYGDRCKMCSVASSSRLCYLYFKDDPDTQFEVAINNGNGCNPHLDAKDHDYYECKCHEIVKNHDIHLSYDVYSKLLKEIFNIEEFEVDDKGIKLNYEMFGIKDAKLPIGKYFDFKQFICHVIGLLTLKDYPNYLGLQYIFFVPSQEQLKSKKLKDWYKTFKDFIDDLFEKFQTLKVFGRCDLGFAISLKKPKFIDVSTVDGDFLLK